MKKIVTVIIIVLIIFMTDNDDKVKGLQKKKKETHPFHVKTKKCLFWTAYSEKGLFTNMLPYILLTFSSLPSSR